MVLKNTAMAGVGKDAECGIRQLLKKLKGVDSGKHGVIVAVRDQHRLGNGLQVIGRRRAPFGDGHCLGLNGLVTDSGVFIRRPFTESRQELAGRPLAGEGRRKEQEGFRMFLFGCAMTWATKPPRE
jgi:hypothetical protein